ncbi:hypothetical protein HP467_01800 [Curtobacterium albidum]|uniref:Uncharacterized protein n=1 Tax=Curtobacterium citreum TaxID=2036 RepID=A0A850DQH2_9MICO|nr:hypothetical protein [Curtobacterium albidum]NUU26849.1 hypothetical protein [Curtobacterium albidum]
MPHTGWALEEYVDVNFDHVLMIELVEPATTAHNEPESTWRAMLTFSDGKKRAYSIADKSKPLLHAKNELQKLRTTLGVVDSKVYADPQLPQAVDSPAN